MLPRSCYDYSTTITDHRLVLSIRSDYDGTGLYDMLSVRRHTYAGACFFFFFLFTVLKNEEKVIRSYLKIENC